MGLLTHLAKPQSQSSKEKLKPNPKDFQTHVWIRHCLFLSCFYGAPSQQHISHRHPPPVQDLKSTKHASIKLRLVGHITLFISCVYKPLKTKHAVNELPCRPFHIRLDQLLFQGRNYPWWFPNVLLIVFLHFLTWYPGYCLCWEKLKP